MCPCPKSIFIKLTSALFRWDDCGDSGLLSSSPFLFRCAFTFSLCFLHKSRSLSISMYVLSFRGSHDIWSGHDPELNDESIEQRSVQSLERREEVDNERGTSYSVGGKLSVVLNVCILSEDLFIDDKGNGQVSAS